MLSAATKTLVNLTKRRPPVEAFERKKATDVKK
jgi:hypothetical protein